MAYRLPLVTVIGSEQTDFQASYKILGHSGSLVSGEPVGGEHCFWGEYTDGVSTRGVGNCGLGKGMTGYRWCDVR